MISHPLPHIKSNITLSVIGALQKYEKEMKIREKSFRTELTGNGRES